MLNHIRLKHKEEFDRPETPEKQPTLSNFVNSPINRKFSGKETDDITRAIVDMVVFDYMPLQMVEGKGFKKLMSIVAPNYNIPSMYLLIFINIYTFTEYPGTRSAKRPSNRVLKIDRFDIPNIYIYIFKVYSQCDLILHLLKQ